MIYILGKYIDEMFVFTYNDGKWTLIDLIEDFPNYKIVYNKLGVNKYYYINKNNLIMTNYLKKIVIKNDEKFLLAEQYKLDKFYFDNNYDNDNSKLYRLLKNIYNSEKFSEIEL